MKNTQLTLVVNNPVWVISEESKRIGRKGLAQARQAMHRPENTPQRAA